MTTKDEATTILCRTFAEIFWVYLTKDEKTQHKVRELVKIAVTNSPQHINAIQALTKILFQKWARKNKPEDKHD